MVVSQREAVQRVLYVDDDPVSRRIFEQLGKTADVRVDACGSLDEAFAYARQHPYSVIAADYSLRRWDGLSVLRELSGLQASASLMLVTDGERKPALPSSLLNYVFVEKPIRRAKVLSQLSEALSAYEERVRTPEAALTAAPILLLSAADATATHLARCVAEQGQGRLRVTRATHLEQALSMLKSLRFAAALIDPARQALSVRELLDKLSEAAPQLPLVLVSDELDRALSLTGSGQLTHLKRSASAELVLHVLYSAVERAERQRAMDALKQNDMITGARNRPTFCEQLARRVDQGDPFVLACFSVDGLALINEALGHVRGDAVLAASTARLMRELGASAMLGRLGGSLFAVLSEAEPPRAGQPAGLRERREAILRIIRQVFELPFDLNDTQVRVAVHAAACEFPGDGANAEELLRAVERALRAAKAASSQPG